MSTQSTPSLSVRQHQKVRRMVESYDRRRRLIVHGLREAGLETGWATYTGNMRSSLTSYDFVWISDPSELQRGDILLNETYHTAIYLGNGMLANASGNEFGAATGGEPGDQTGREIWIRSYYDYPWNGVLRLRSYVA